MAPKRNQPSSRSSRKAKAQPKMQKTTNGTSPTGPNDTSLEHDSNNMHGSGYNHSSTTLQDPSNQQGRYQYIDRPWEQYTANTSYNDDNKTSPKHGSTNMHGSGYNHSSTTLQDPSNQQGGYQYIDRPGAQHTTNTSYTVAASDAFPMERWLNADSYDQPWHGIGPVYVDAQNNDMDQSKYGGEDMKTDDIDSMACEGSFEGRSI